MTGRVILHGKPVAGVGLRVGAYPLQAFTSSSGAISYRVDTTLPERHVATVGNVTRATVGGKAASTADRKALLGLHNGFSVGYKIEDLHIPLAASARGKTLNIWEDLGQVFSWFLAKLHRHP